MGKPRSPIQSPDFDPEQLKEYIGRKNRIGCNLVSIVSALQLLFIVVSVGMACLSFTMLWYRVYVTGTDLNFIYYFYAFYEEGKELKPWNFVGLEAAMAGLLICVIIQFLSIVMMIASMCIRLFARIQPDPVHQLLVGRNGPPRFHEQNKWCANWGVLVASSLNLIFSCAFIGVYETQVLDGYEFYGLWDDARRKSVPAEGRKFWSGVCAANAILVIIEIIHVLLRRRKNHMAPTLTNAGTPQVDPVLRVARSEEEMKQYWQYCQMQQQYAHQPQVMQHYPSQPAFVQPIR